MSQNKLYVIKKLSIVQLTFKANFFVLFLKKSMEVVLYGLELTLDLDNLKKLGQKYLLNLFYNESVEIHLS